MAKYIDIGANLTKKELYDQIDTILEESKNNNIEIIITGTTVRKFI